jgi:hypothetical protein
MVWLMGEMAYTHPACVTLIVWPATVNVPFRVGPVLFEAML